LNPRGVARMRIALIADIPGNALALETVLGHIDAQGVDGIACLGDIAALGPDPARCVDLVRERASLTVIGNTDDWLLRANLGETPDVSDSDTLNELTAWARARLTDEHLAWLDGLPRVADLRVSPATVIQLFHGSPRSLDDVLSASTPPAILDELFGGVAASVFAAGHTHVPLLRRWGSKVLVNPGSVGLPGIGPAGAAPPNEDVHWAEYMIADSSAQGTSFTFHRIPISVRQLAHVVRASGMPAGRWWMGLWRGGA